MDFPVNLFSETELSASWVRKKSTVALLIILPLSLLAILLSFFTFSPSEVVLSRALFPSSVIYESPQELLDVKGISLQWISVDHVAEPAALDSRNPGFKTVAVTFHTISSTGKSAAANAPLLFPVEDFPSISPGSDYFVLMAHPVEWGDRLHLFSFSPICVCWERGNVLVNSTQSILPLDANGKIAESESARWMQVSGLTWEQFANWAEI